MGRETLILRSLIRRYISSRCIRDNNGLACSQSLHPALKVFKILLFIKECRTHFPKLRVIPHSRRPHFSRTVYDQNSRPIRIMESTYHFQCFHSYGRRVFRCVQLPLQRHQRFTEFRVVLPFQLYLRILITGRRFCTGSPNRHLQLFLNCFDHSFQ